MASGRRQQRAWEGDRRVLGVQEGMRDRELGCQENDACEKWAVRMLSDTKTPYQGR